MATQVDHEAESEQRAVSNRKVQSNRQNASKSTGPRTPRGKGLSRRNALKHGLFAMDVYIATLTAWEDPDEYKNLRDRLAEDYQPLGAAEELEVDRIAACWWKLSRVWRYENAEIAGDLVKKQPKLNKPERLSAEDQVWYFWLKTAESEIAHTGKISDELKEKMFADTGFRKLWDFAEKEICELSARGMSLSVPRIKEIAGPTPQSRTQFHLATILHAVHFLGRGYATVVVETAKHVHDLAAVPAPDVLDTVIRAETAADRSLGRAMARLERMQHRRKEESDFPPGDSISGSI